MLMILSTKDNDEELRDKYYILFTQGQITVHTMENGWVLLVSDVMNSHVWKYIFSIMLVKFIKTDIEVSQCVDHNYYSNECLILTTPKNNVDIKKMKIRYPSQIDNPTYKIPNQLPDWQQMWILTAHKD